MIKVLLVPSSDYVGHPFPQRHNQIFERLHDGKNYEVHIFRFRLFDNPKLKTKLTVHEPDDMKVRSAAFYYLMNMADHVSEVRRVVKRENVDAVVLSNLAMPFAYTLMEELSSMRVPIIFDLPDYYPASASGYMFDIKSIPGRLLTGIFDFMLRYMIRRATAVTAASNALVKYAKRAGARSTMHIPNGISECFLKLHDGEALREKLGFDQDDMIVGYIGSVEFWLDMRSLVKGIALAREGGLSVKLVIVGKGLHSDYLKKVMKWISQEGLENHVKWLDFVPHEEAPRYIAGFDTGVIPFDVFNPTAYYSSPNKMWEYLSQMKPVISTPIPEALNNGDCLFIASTPQDYVERFLLIAKKQSEVFSKVKNGYKKALDNTWKNSTKLFASVLQHATN